MTVEHHTAPPDNDVLTSTVVLEGVDVDVVTHPTNTVGFLSECNRYIVRNGAIKHLDNSLSPSEPHILHGHATDVQSCARAVARYVKYERERDAEPGD